MKRMIAAACTCLVAAGTTVATAGAHHAGPADAGPSGLDKQYLTTSMQGDLFELQGGKLAEQRSHNKAVLRLARTLVADHTSSLKDSAKLARRLGVEVPRAATQSQQWELQMVSTLHGKAFDRWYSSLEARDHEQDISETTDEVNDGSNSEVVADAKHELPMLHRHLQLARAALRASH